MISAGKTNNHFHITYPLRPRFMRLLFAVGVCFLPLLLLTAKLLVANS